MFITIKYTNACLIKMMVTQRKPAFTNSWGSCFLKFDYGYPDIYHKYKMFNLAYTPVKQ